MNHDRGELSPVGIIHHFLKIRTILIFDGEGCINIDVILRKMIPLISSTLQAGEFLIFDALMAKL